MSKRGSAAHKAPPIVPMVRTGRSARLPATAEILACQPVSVAWVSAA